MLMESFGSWWGTKCKFGPCKESMCLLHKGNWKFAQRTGRTFFSVCRGWLTLVNISAATEDAPNSTLHIRFLLSLSNKIAPVKIFPDLPDGSTWYLLSTNTWHPFFIPSYNWSDSLHAQLSTLFTLETMLLYFLHCHLFFWYSLRM
jgi:hypothetical protein